MPSSAKILTAVFGIMCLICFVKMIKSGHFFKSFLFSSLSGIGSLFAVNLLTTFTGVSIAVNWFTLAFCTFTGVCGSISLLVMSLAKLL